MPPIAYWHSLQHNAIFARELRRSGWRGWLTVALVIALMSLPVWLCVLTTYGGGIETLVTFLQKFSPPSAQSSRGDVFALITMLAFNLISAFVSAQGLLVTVATWAMPALIAPLITRERELGTWDLLRSTPLTARQIVWGKLAGALVRYPLWLLAAATFPAQLAVTTLPGAAIGNILTSPRLMSSQVMGQNLSWQLALASGGAGLLMIAQQIAGMFAGGGISLLCSTFTRRSSSAIALAYAGMIFAQTLGSGLVWIVTMVAVIAWQSKTTPTTGDPSWVSMALIFGLPMLSSLIYNLALGGVGMAWGFARADRSDDA